MNTGKVMVGYDGSGGARAAADWALDEAARRHAPLELLYAYELPVTVPAASLVPSISLPPAPEVDERLGGLLAEARRAAEARDPTVPVTTTVAHGAAAPVLCDRSRHADLLVVGSRGHGGWAGLLLGSVSATVAAHAHCPVVVVRGDAPARPGDPRPVVVGVDGSPSGQHALGFAFEQAAARGVPLTAVRAWQQVGPPWTDLEVDAVAATEDEQAAVDDLLVVWREKHPAVAVRACVVEDHPGHALVAASADAQLVVVGSRGHGGLSGLLLGSVSRQLAQHAACPVAVVRGPATQRDR